MQCVDAHALGRPIDSNDSALTSSFPPFAPNEPRDAHARDEETRFLEDLLASDLTGFNPPKVETSLCKSCKKTLPPENFDIGKKTCRCCLRTHRNHMRHKRRKLKNGSAAPVASGMAMVRNALEADSTDTARSEDSGFQKVSGKSSGTEKSWFSG
jgi:hypothetical protein